jgi:hypothetical protein
MLGELESFALDAPVHAVFELVTPHATFVRRQQYGRQLYCFAASSSTLSEVIR